MTFAMGTPLLDGCVLAILDQEDTTATPLPSG